jgi:D-xylose transport system permease protein
MTTIEAQTPEAEVGRPESDNVGALVRGYVERLRAGDVGILPVMFGLIVITVFFWSKNHNFLTAGNFNNLVVQMAGVTIIAIGVVFVLLLGEIDLSIGFVSGVGGVIVAELQQPGKSWHVSGLIAIAIAVIGGAAIGALQGSFVAVIGVPSFVVTLAGLLAWQGVIIKAIGIQGVIGIQDPKVNDVANYYFPDNWGWGFAIAASAAYAGTVLFGIISRRRAGVHTRYLWLAPVKIVLVAGICFFVAAVSNRDRGVAFALLLMTVLLVFWTYIAKRTLFGRHVYAVGGNAEAARRAGINVKRIRMIVFMISSGMAALGGVVFAARLSSVDLNAGGGTILLDAISAAVIGGTSLFGGRGEVRNALMGSLLIAAIANGINTVGYSSATQYITTGIILLAAVTLDTVLRRRQAAAGR